MDGIDPDGNKKYVLNPTVVIPDDGWVRTIECESPGEPPVQVIVVIPAARFNSWCCAVPKFNVTTVFADGADCDDEIPAVTVCQVGADPDPLDTSAWPEVP